VVPCIAEERAIEMVTISMAPSFLRCSSPPSPCHASHHTSRVAVPWAAIRYLIIGILTPCRFAAAIA